MPHRAMRLDLRPINSSPWNLIDPLRFASIPMMARMVVVLPAPLRPSKVTTSPPFTSKLMPCRTWLSPYQPLRSRTLSCASAMTRPHIGFDDLGVPGDLAVIAFGEDFTTREHGDPLRQVGNHRQVVLDHQDGAVLGNAPDQSRGALDVFRAHAGHRLIEQQDFGIKRERGGNLQRPLAPIRQFDRGQIGVGLDTYPIEELGGTAVEDLNGALRLPKMIRGAERPLQGDANILQDR